MAQEGDGASRSDRPPEEDAWQTALEGLDLLVLDPGACHLHGDADGRLWGEVHQREHAELLAYRTHPLTAPNEWISLVSVADPDGDGHRSDGGNSDRVEVGVLANLEALDAESRTAVERTLHLRYFLPRILQIVAAHDEDPGQSGAVQWDLLTDRGPMHLRMVSLFEGIQQLDDGRIIFSDRDGNRAEIPALDTLDRDSRRLLERYYWF